MSHPKKIYIAGPYTTGDTGKNISVAMQAWHELADLGYSPFCPHLCHYLHIHHQRPYKEWMQYDEEWLMTCDALLRLPGESPGARKEAALASAMGIPVFHSIADLLDEDTSDDEESPSIEEKFSRLIEALMFYENPDTYHAVSLAFDPPCGPLINDLEYNTEYKRKLPGKLARETLDWLLKYSKES